MTRYFLPALLLLLPLHAQAETVSTRAYIDDWTYSGHASDLDAAFSGTIQSRLLLDFTFDALDTPDNTVTDAGQTRSGYDWGTAAYNFGAGWGSLGPSGGDGGQGFIQVTDAVPDTGNVDNALLLGRNQAAVPNANYFLYEFVLLGFGNTGGQTLRAATLPDFELFNGTDTDNTFSVTLYDAGSRVLGTLSSTTVTFETMSGTPLDQPAPVPLPASLTLLFGALAGLRFLRRA